MMLRRKVRHTLQVLLASIMLVLVIRYVGPESFHGWRSLPSGFIVSNACNYPIMFEFRDGKTGRTIFIIRIDKGEQHIMESDGLDSDYVHIIGAALLNNGLLYVWHQADNEHIGGQSYASKESQAGTAEAIALTIREGRISQW